jgi:serine/threonine protein kinase
MGSPATRLGDVLNDAYELQELLSSTKQLEVYRARDKRTRGAVQVTVLRPEFALQGRVVDSFLRGPRSLAAVSHQSLPLVRVDTDDTGIPFVVEEAVEGRSLAGLIASFPQGMPVAMVRQLSLPLVEALALAHEHGMVHGSIDAEHVKLLGEVHAPSPKWIGLGAEQTQQDVNYRAPELGDSTDPRIEPRVDVFAVGVLLYSMLSGELPFRSGKRSAVPLDEIAPQLSRAWVELTRSCLEQQADARLPDALALLTRLRACNDNRAAAEPAPTATIARAKAERKNKPAPKRDARVDSDPRPAAVEPSPPAQATRAESPAAVRGTDATLQAAPAAQGAKAAAPAAARADGAARASPPAAAAPEAKPDSKPPKDKKQAALEAAGKLSAKHKPRDAAASPVAATPSAASAPLASPAAASEPSAPPPQAAAAPLELAPVRKAARPTPAQAAAVALTSAQLDALRALRGKDEQERDRWAGIFFMLVFIALLQFGVPLLREPHMTSAQILLGPKLRIAASAFSLVAVVAAVRIWVAQLRSKTLIHRITTFLMQVIAVSIVLLTATLYSHSAPLNAAAGLAKRALPWGTGALFFLLALQFLLRGIRDIGTDLLYGAVILAMSGASLYGSYSSGVATILDERKRAAARMAGHSGASPLDIKQELMDKSSMSDWQQRHQNNDNFEQRKEVGANEEDDLKSVDQLEGTRKQNQRELEDVRKGMASPEAESP